MLEQVCPGWGAAPIRRYADYLGFCLGPEAGERAWAKALEKVTKRAAAWSALELGLNLTTMAYNVYVATVMTFLLQLDRLPQAWPRTEAAAFRRLAPGPGQWILPIDLHALRDSLGLP